MGHDFVAPMPGYRHVATYRYFRIYAPISSDYWLACTIAGTHRFYGKTQREVLEAVDHYYGTGRKE